jgi:presenilin-like A22 family membrane protease
MKHDKWITVEMLLWTIISIAFSWWILPMVKDSINVPEGVDIWFVGLFLVIGLAIGTIAWMFILKRWRTYGIYIFGMSIGLATFELAIKAFKIDMLLATLLGVTLALFYIGTVMTMRLNWNNVLRLYWIANICMMIAIIFGATVGAWRLSPLVAMCLLGLAAVYDAIAVWKTEHMQNMAIKLRDDLTLPGIMVPYKKTKNKMAILGGGDVFFVILVGGSFLKTSQLTAAIVMIAMTLSIVVLFLISKKDKFYPALPFILAGALGGIVVSVVLSWMGI